MFRLLGLISVAVLYLALFGELCVKYPSNHGGGVCPYGWCLLFVGVLNSIDMIMNRKISWLRVGLVLGFGLVLIACDSFNVLVGYETWIERDMPAWGSRCAKSELCPSNIEELVSLSADELERVDLGRMNLICAEAASDSGDSELPRLLRKLDEWAETAKRAEEKYWRTFERNPERYDNSYAKFRAVNLILTVKEDFKCRYQMSLVESGELHNVNSPAFFKNPDDVFISGLLKNRRGTCSSYAPLIVALGRRLGYPLYLKATNGHLFCFWDDGKESFNIDTNGNGVDTPTDDHYFSDGNHRLSGLSKANLERERLMCPLKAVDCLSFFLETVGYCHEANGRLPEAQRFYNLSLQYRPGAVNLTRLASRRVITKSAANGRAR